jgi:TonB-dependent starch-binding outer membrane protein SusC
MNALFLAVLSLAAQAPDSAAATSSDPDRIVIDAAGIVREGGVQSLADLLNSRVPGLLVIPGSGLNGGGFRIRFAGPRRLLSDGAPLILVDGIRVDAAADASPFDLGGPGPLRLDDFSLEDIESIEVVANPATAMIHGPGAADGVILIRTKRGRSGPLQVEGYAQGWLEAVSTRWPANFGGVDADNPNPDVRTGCSLSYQAAGYCVQDFVQSFNPLVQRSPFNTAVRHHAGFNATGGPDWGAFRLAAGIDGDGGVYDIPVIRNPNSYSRWNVTSSGAIRPHPRVHLGFTLTHALSNLQLPTYWAIRSALLGPSDSSAFSWPPFFISSPRERVDRTSGVAEAQGRVLSWLTARAMIGIDNVDQGDIALMPGFGRTEALREVRNTTTAWSLAASGPSIREFGFRTTVGWERVDRQRREQQYTGPDTEPFCATACNSLWLSLPRRSVGAYLIEDITFRDRIALTMALRYDKFKQMRQHQTNPLVRVSWVAKPNRSGPLSGLRLHASYGSASGTGLPDGVSFVFVPIGTTVPPVRPDRVKSLEAGADAQLFSGRWDARVTLYDFRSDVLEAVFFSGPGGAFPGFASGAKIQNQGIVATLSGALMRQDDVRWDVRLSLWGNRNRLRALFGPERIVTQGQGLMKGYPTAGYWGRRVSGFADANGDGIIESSEVVIESQPTWAGTPYPTQGAALQSSLRLGQRVRLTTTLDYRAGHVLFNRSAWDRCQLASVCRDRHDPATPLHRQAVAVASSSTGIPLQYFEDADYLKLRELQVSFDLPAHTAGLMGARETTITLAARNLFTWTRYSGGDPEAGSYGTAAPDGVTTIADFGATPVVRSVAVQVRFSR